MGVGIRARLVVLPCLCCSITSVVVIKIGSYMTRLTCHRKHFLRDVQEEAAEVDFCCLTLGFLLARMKNGFVWTVLQEGVLVLQLLVSRSLN